MLKPKSRVSILFLRTKTWPVPPWSLRAPIIANIASKSSSSNFVRNIAFIIIDCPPTLDLITLNALVASDSVLIPVQCEYLALEGVSELLDTLMRIRRTLNPTLAIEGIVLTMYDERTTLSRQVAADLRSFFGTQVFESVIPRNVRLAEAPSHGKPILFYDIHSKGAEAYIQLAREVIANGQKRAGAGAGSANSGA